MCWKTHQKVPENSFSKSKQGNLGDMRKPTKSGNFSRLAALRVAFSINTISVFVYGLGSVYTKFQVPVVFGLVRKWAKRTQTYIRANMGKSPTVHLGYENAIYWNDITGRNKFKDMKFHKLCKFSSQKYGIYVFRIFFQMLSR